MNSGEPAAGCRHLAAAAAGLRVPSGGKAEARAEPGPQTCHEVENGKVSRFAVRVGQK